MVSVSGILNRELITHRIMSRIIGVMTFAVLTALGAFVRIPLPFSPVPLTLQTFFVLLSGAILGAHLGFLSQLTYLALGAAGLPIFANAGSGLNYLFGPTGGYILGFILASFFVGAAIKFFNIKRFSPIFFWMFIGDLIILLLGILWLGVLFGYSLKKVILIGLLPFLPGDLLKVAVASNIFFKIQARLKQIF